MIGSYVVTGGARGIGRAITARLAADGHVAVVDIDADALAWTAEHPQITAVPGDAGDEAVTDRAADAAEAAAPLLGWVNNAAVFHEATLHDGPAAELLELIILNLALAVTGCATAIRRFLASGHPGAIVNVSSHQAQRPVAGALPYATAKAAIEGLTRACRWMEDAPYSATTPSHAASTPKGWRTNEALSRRGHRTPNPQKLIA